MDLRHFVRVVALIGALALIGSACTSTASKGSIPELTEAASVDLQARTFARACQDVLCAGTPMYSSDDTPAPVREAIKETFTDEVEYLSDSNLAEITDTNGVFDSGGTLINVGNVHKTERSDVVGVDAWIARGLYNVVGRTYLWRWNGTVWVATTPDAVDVTVTTAVS